MRQQCGGEADGTKKVGCDDGFGVGCVCGLEKAFRAHDACVEDDNIYGGKVGGELPGEGRDRCRIFNVESYRRNTGIGFGGLVEELLPAAGDDDFVAEFVEGLGEPAADARTAAGDEDRVASRFHESVLLKFLDDEFKVYLKVLKPVCNDVRVFLPSVHWM